MSIAMQKKISIASQSIRARRDLNKGCGGSFLKKYNFE